MFILLKQSKKIILLCLRTAYCSKARKEIAQTYYIDFIYVNRRSCYTISVCSSNGIQPVAIFGPQKAISDGAIRDQCAIANIPHIQAAWQPLDPDLELNEQEEENGEEGEEPSPEGKENEEEAEEELEFKKISINFYPDSEDIALAYGKLVKYYNWTSFAVLYEDNFGMLPIFLSNFTLSAGIVA